MPKRTLNPEGLPTPRGSYFHVAVADPGRVEALAGQTASDVDGNIVGAGDVGAQTREVLRKLRVAIESVGGTIDDIVADWLRGGRPAYRRRASRDRRR